MPRTPGSKNKLECSACKIKYQAHLVKDGKCSFCRQTDLIKHKEVNPETPNNLPTLEEVKNKCETPVKDNAFVIPESTTEELRNAVKKVAVTCIDAHNKSTFEYVPSEELGKQIAHERICQELTSLYLRKNHDYGDSFSDTYKKLGIVSAVTRIYDKMNRLCSLSTKEQKVHDESIRDTLIDAANYCIMTVMELDRELPKPRTKKDWEV